MVSPFPGRNERRAAVRRILRLAGFGGVALCLVYALLGGAYPLPALIRLRAEMQAAEADVTHLKATVDSLLSYRDSLTHSARVIEREARERYGLIANGEILYRFVTPSGADWKSILGDSAVIR